MKVDDDNCDYEYYSVQSPQLFFYLVLLDNVQVLRRILQRTAAG